jgi:branched-chain amino acid transport system permease protein
MFCIVVLGGTGSIPGVLVGTLGMIVLPEILRFVRDWRDGFVGLAMVLMMIFRPTGLWPSRRVALEIAGEEAVVPGAEMASPT